MAARAALGIGAVSPSLSYNFGHGHGPTWLHVGPRDARGYGSGLSSGLYTTRVPPAAAPHAGHQAAFVFGVILAVLFILGLFD